MPSSSREATARARGPRPNRQLEDRYTGSSSRGDDADPAAGALGSRFRREQDGCCAPKIHSIPPPGRSAATEAAMAGRCGSSSAAGAAMTDRPVVRGLGATASPITTGASHGNGGLFHDVVDDDAVVKREIDVTEPPLTRRHPRPASARNAVAKTSSR